MIVIIRDWYSARSERERRLLQIMLAIFIPLLIWLLLVVPLGNAYDEALRKQLQAVDRNGRIKALAAQATGTAAVPSAVPDLALLLSDSASQRGITAESRVGSSPGSAAITIASSPAPTALDWLRGLEAAGYRLSDVRIAPSGAGAVTVSATVSGSAR